MLATRMRMSSGQRFYPYKINQSCRFNDNDSAYLYKTPGSESDARKKTISVWLKRCNLGMLTSIAGAYYNGTNYEVIRFQADNTLWWSVYQSSTYISILSTQVFRDVTGWYHFLFVQDTTEAVQANRVRVYCNGSEITSWSTRTCVLGLNSVNPYLFTDSSVVSTIAKGITTDYLDGYLAETYYIDGQALTPSSFGQEKNGIWVPKKYTSTYGNNGFYLDFANSADLGNDVSGNNNDFTSSGLTSEDQVLDSPTNNYPTLNPLEIYGWVTRDGNLKAANTGDYNCIGTEAFPKTGKWYFEINVTGAYLKIGVIPTSEITTATNPASARWYYGLNGQKYVGVTGSTYGASYTTGDVIGIAYDADTGDLTFYKNNVSQGIAWVLNTSLQWISYFGQANIAGHVMAANFGQLGFAYTPPTGYKALCSKNIAIPPVKDSSKGFDVVLYEGNATPRNIADLNFDISAGGLIWIKNRDAADEHKLIDTVRGATKELSSNDTSIESTDTNGLTSFLSNGFSLGTGANGYNDNNESFVAWCFRMGSRYGFDIQSYTGTGVAHAENHNLGGVPELMMVKSRDGAARYWYVYHHHAWNKTDPETDYGLLNVANAWQDNVVWNDTAPTSTQFTIGSSDELNANNNNYIMYLWRSIPQFSKVFSYIGNGNADGPFVCCGFRPGFILYKSSHTAQSWIIFDVKRDTYNKVNKYLVPDQTVVEGTTVGIELDILSNGFKIRGAHVNINQSTITYIGIAYAEQPGKYSNAR